MVVGEHALAVEGGGNGKAELLGEASQRLGGASAGRAVPGQDEGPTAAVEHRGGAPDLRGRGLVGPGDVELQWDETVWHGHRLEVLGHRQVDGAGALGLGQLEGLSDHFGDRPRRQHQVRPLGHRGEHRHQVDTLVGLLVDAIQPHLRRAYLFIDARSWKTTRPVASAWIGQQLAISAEHIRLIRIYQEVEATGENPRLVRPVRHVHRQRGPLGNGHQPHQRTRRLQRKQRTRPARDPLNTYWELHHDHPQPSHSPR